MNETDISEEENRLLNITYSISDTAFGRILRFDPRNSRFAAVECIIGSKYPRIYCVVVDCLLVSDWVKEGAFIAFTPLGSQRDSDGIVRAYGVAICNGRFIGRGGHDIYQLWRDAHAKAMNPSLLTRILRWLGLA